MRREQMIERQNRCLEGYPYALGRALHNWTSYMQGGEVAKGYSSHSAGFGSGGITSFDDCMERVDHFEARAVEAAVDSLDLTSRICVGIVWLGCGQANRLDVDAICHEAMGRIYRLLLEKGAL